MKITRQNIALELATEQLRRIGFKGDPYEEIKKADWFSINQWPDSETEEKFREWATDQIRKTFRIPKYRAKRGFSWFNLAWGLKPPEEQK